MRHSTRHNQQRKRIASKSPKIAKYDRNRRKSEIVINLGNSDSDSDDDHEVEIYENEGSVLDAQDLIESESESESDISDEEWEERMPNLSSVLADLHGKEIDDEIYTEPESLDLTRDQALPGDSNDEPETEIQSPKSSPKEIRQEALLKLKEKRKLSQERPKGIKREDTGLRRKFRQPTPDSDSIEIYSSEDEIPVLKEPFIPDPPKRGTGKRFIWIYRS